MENENKETITENNVDKTEITDIPKVLIIEDNETERLSLKAALETEKIIVDVAKDGLSAEEIVKSKYFDIAIIDYKLPDTDGINLIKRLKFLLPEIMTLIVTAHSSVDIAIEALRMGAYDYITKPLDMNLLLNVVRKMKQYKEDFLISKQKLIELHTKNEIKYLFKDEDFSIITTPNPDMLLLSRKNKNNLSESIKKFFLAIKNFYWGN